MTDAAPDLEALASQLESSGRYRVLRKFVPVAAYGEADVPAVKSAVALDVETTGMDAAADAIIQLSMVPFTYDPNSGRVFSVGTPLTFFEDPGRPIPAVVVALTGITDADVAGKRIDDAAVGELATSASLVIAHNAEFDRPFMERRLGVFRDRPWACSLREIPWKEMGSASASLEYLIYRHCGMYFDAHRADHDCLALIHVLATPFEDGTSPLKVLLTSARSRTVRIWAEGAPIEVKDVLKARKYKWNPGADGRPKAWYREVTQEQLKPELEWLAQNAFGGVERTLRMDKLDATTRYSKRS